MLLNALNADLKFTIWSAKQFISSFKLNKDIYVGSIFISDNPYEISVNIRAVQHTISRSSDKKPAFKVAKI